MATIERVRGFEILDSRGHPTIAAEVVLSDGARLRSRALRRIHGCTGSA